MNKPTHELLAVQVPVPVSLMVRDETHAPAWLNEVSEFVESEAYAA